MSYREIPYSEACTFCEAVFASYGFDPAQRKAITDVLLRADLCGIESHGIQRLIRYHREIESGKVDVHAMPEVVFSSKLAAVLDAQKAMGQLVSIQAMQMAIALAKSAGTGIVTVRNSNHFGIAAYYTDMAVEEDLIGVCMTNTEAICVPTFGKRAMLGTNPLAVALPADPIPFSFDTATTVVPRGKLEVYAKNDRPLPAQWAVDADGQPTRDAALVLRNIIEKRGGGILPLGGLGETCGGHKGYGLAALVDIFCGILSGGMTSNHINLLPDQTGICHCFAAIDYGMFGEKAHIRAELSCFLQALRDSDKAAGEARIYTHGEKEAECRGVRRHGAIPVNDKTWDELRAISAERAVPMPANS